MTPTITLISIIIIIIINTTNIILMMITTSLSLSPGQPYLPSSQRLVWNKYEAEKYCL